VGGYTDRITERQQGHNIFEENEDHSSSPSQKMKQQIGQISQSSINNREGRINKTRMDYLKSLVSEKRCWRLVI